VAVLATETGQDAGVLEKDTEVPDISADNSGSTRDGGDLVDGRGIYFLFKMISLFNPILFYDQKFNYDLKMKKRV